MADKRVLITGASGLLGRAVYSAFKKSGWTILAIAHSRTGEHLVNINICQQEQVRVVVHDFRPSCIVHCAAQRFPDKVEKDYDGTLDLNVQATENLAILAGECGAFVLYISTDYVFDGTKPPYTEEDEPNPLNAYGKTKLLGEQRTLQVSKGNLVLRVPILYGPVEYLGESAVTVLFELLFKQENKSVSDCEVRYPADVRDVAFVCVALCEKKLESADDIHGIYHCGGKESMTKYGMLKHMSQAFQLPMDHIVADPNPVPGPPRPQNAQLSNSRIDSLGITKHTPFAEAITTALRPWLGRFPSP